MPDVVIYYIDLFCRTQTNDDDDGEGRRERKATEERFEK